MSTGCSLEPAGAEVLGHGDGECRAVGSGWGIPEGAGNAGTLVDAGSAEVGPGDGHCGAQPDGEEVLRTESSFSQG